MIRSRSISPVLALAGMAVLLFCPALLGQSIPDPGETTWLEFEGMELRVGESRFIPVHLFSDEAIDGLMLRFSLNTPDTDFVSDPTDYVHLDSVTYLYHPKYDPLTLDYRPPVAYLGNQLGDGSDTVALLMGCSDPPHVPLPAGINDFLIMYWFTGVAPGYITLEVTDSSSVRLFPDGTPLGNSGYFYPAIRYAGAFENRYYIVGDPSDPIICTDPGAPDLISLEGNVEGYPLGESTPVTLTLTNDESLNGFNFSLSFSSAVSSAIQVDSVHYVGRLENPTVNSLRLPIWNVNGVLPETAGAMTTNVAGQPLGSGSAAVAEVFITAAVETDVTVVASGGGKAVCPQGEAEGFSMPSDVLIVHVGAALAPAPEFQALNAPEPVVGGEPVGFMVQASSPIGNPVAVTLESLYLYDSLYAESVSPPSFVGGFFMWTPDPADVGIWKATFVATDQVSGRTAETYAVIQVVSGSDYLLSCQTVETADAMQANGMVHGDYDQDGWPEIVVAGDGWVTTLSYVLYDHLGSGQLQAGFTSAEDLPARGLAAGYIDEDDYLDAVFCLWREVWVMLGDGNGGFTILDADVAIPGGYFIDAVLTDFNGDAYLDYVCLSSPSGSADPGVVTVYAGGAGGVFSQTLVFNIGAPGLTVASSDLNNDGWDDLIVGIGEGLEVYLNTGAGSYILSYSNTCNLGTSDIDITNQGADFNGDGIFDLCVAAPGTGVNAGLSDLEIYLGQGDGTFIAQSVKVLYGSVSRIRTGEFNGDGLLDIAFINSTEGYLGLLFGDEAGTFRNQLRYDVPKYFARELDCMDIDADGDLDLVVGAFVMDPYTLYSSLFVFMNELDPVGAVSTSMRVEAFDNVDVEIVAPNGARLNKVSNSLPSASLYRRNLNGNSDLDAEIVASAVSSGAHLLRVSPRPNTLPGETFSLDYSPCYKTTHQLVRDLPVPSEEYDFPIFPDGVSPISPFQGKRLQCEHPTFEWDFMGTSIQMQSSLPFSDRGYDFRLAHDPAFENIIETASIDDNRYTLQASLSVDGLTSYFWQVRPAGQTDWSGIFVFHLLPPGLPDVNESNDLITDDSDFPPVIPGQIPTDVDDDAGAAGQVGALPTEFALQQNYPNPFNPSTGIPYSLPRASHVKLEIFNVLGMRIATLVDEQQGAGSYEAFWNAGELSSGIYLYRLTTDEFSATKKMLLLK
jgi:hypothetical protein